MRENTIIVGDFKHQFTSIDKFSGKKINQATEILNDKIEVRLNYFLDLTPPPPKKKNRIYILFKYTCNISWIDHILGHKLIPAHS